MKRNRGILQQHVLKCYKETFRPQGQINTSLKSVFQKGALKQDRDGE